MNLPRFSVLCPSLALSSHADEAAPRLRSDPPVITSSWDDVLEGVKTAEDWEKHRAVLKQRYLDLIRDQHKPAKVPLDLKVHEETEIEGKYRRLCISYQVPWCQALSHPPGHMLPWSHWSRPHGHDARVQQITRNFLNKALA